jgi:hypothetical protein
MAPLIKRISRMPLARDLLRGGAPGVACLAAAMQQQDGRAAVAEHVGNQLVAGGADEGRGGRGQMPGHSRHQARMYRVRSGAECRRHDRAGFTISFRISHDNDLDGLSERAWSS